MFKVLEILKSYSGIYMFKTFDKDNVDCKSYEDYINDVEKCAWQLEKLCGTIEDKHIGIIGKSGYEYLVLLAAIIFSRGVAVPLNENETEENLGFAIKNAEIDILIASSEKEYRYEGITVFSYETVFDQDSDRLTLKDFDDEESERLALILFTSGTTSLSKGVALSVGNLFYDQLLALPKICFDDPSKALGMMTYSNFPFYHLAGIVIWLSAAENGGTLCYSKDARNILKDLECNRIDCAVVTPAVLKLWVNCIKHDRMGRLGFVKHIISGGAIIEPELVRFFTANGITVAQYYGQTETGGVVTCNYETETNPESIGKAIKGADISIRDGEICVRYWGNMQGYYNNPDETAKYLKDGVIYTGDLGYIDDNGYVYITGRKKNLIILSGGENESPEEIEAKLYGCNEIKECRVYEKNDRIIADIFAPGIEKNDIKSYVDSMNKNMPIYKRISKFNLCENELEKTSIGKIKRQ